MLSPAGPKAAWAAGGRSVFVSPMEGHRWAETRFLPRRPRASRPRYVQNFTILCCMQPRCMVHFQARGWIARLYRKCSYSPVGNVGDTWRLEE